MDYYDNLVPRSKTWKESLPKNLNDGLGFLFLLTIVIVTFVYEVKVVLPALLDPSTSTFIVPVAVAVGAAMLLQIYGNFYHLVTTDTSSAHILVKSDQTDGWRLCYACEAMSPPRSSHCATCNSCILKREHHCLFSGCCVGHWNQRYFILFLFHLWMGAVYAAALNIAYFKTTFIFRSIFQILHFLFPLFLILFDDEPWSVFSCFMLSLTIGTSLFLGAMLLYHCKMMVRNVTSYDIKHSVDFWRIPGEKGNSIRANVELVMGRRWLAVLWNPWAQSPLPHDGVQWDKGKAT
ncbi:unnamed protein product [Cyprideis torosa]|uniref:Palmitoyltransferase n=1 Tax=Cyprideis torosa TaxID=163714 RepID=A0A7R8W6F4_9CRUS|nr:unnamed protein product [Cyprideis torosa]CAG0886366.1 unnamed protein product [Cyprideis torosa]